MCDKNNQYTVYTLFSNCVLQKRKMHSFATRVEPGFKTLAVPKMTFSAFEPLWDGRYMYMFRPVICSVMIHEHVEWFCITLATMTL